MVDLASGPVPMVSDMPLDPVPMFTDVPTHMVQAESLTIVPPTAIPAPAISEHMKAKHYIIDFAGRYATSPATRGYLQTAINAAQRKNCPIAPSERRAAIMTFTCCFEALLKRDPSLNNRQRTDRLTQLQQSLAVLDRPFTLPDTSRRAR